MRQKDTQAKSKLKEVELMRTSDDTAIESSSDKSSRLITSPIHYSQTRVVRVNDEVLANNRVVAHNKEDPRSIPFQMLRAKALAALRTNNWNSLAITAPTQGSGKTMIAVNLAMSIAQESNQTVLLVDLDLRKPSMHEYFGIQPKFGISDFVNHDTPIMKMLVNPGVERLILLPGRQRIVNSSEAISTPAFKAMVEELKERYESRIIIFDLPPVLVSDDVFVFLQYIDCSLLVVESGQNTKKEIQDSMSLLSAKPSLGTILNKETDIKDRYDYFY